MNSTTSGRAYYPVLDGIRGVAIIMVIVSHNFSFLPLPDMLSSMGVDLFFVLSGFLITDILLKSKTKQHYFSQFYIRRTLRVFPVYYLTIILFYWFGAYSQGLVVSYEYYANHWPFVLFHLNNLLPVFYIKPEGQLILNHFWSLSFEEQFYLIWPFFIYFTPYRKMLVCILLVIGLAVFSRFFCWLHLREGYRYWYITTNIRIDCLAIGGLLAALRYIYPARYPRLFFTFCLSVFTIHLLALVLKNFYSSFPHFTIVGYSSFSCLCGLLILYGITPLPHHLVFTARPLIYFGKISYGLYIFHWPILMLSNLYLIPLLNNQAFLRPYSIEISGFLAAILAIMISTLSYYYFERNIMRLNKRKE